MMKIIPMFFRISLIVAVSALMFGCTKPSSADSNAAATPAPAANSSNHAFPAQTPEDKIPRIKADEAKKLVEENKAIVIDVRGTDAYKLTHIKGALDVSLSKLEKGDFTGLPKDKMIIAYCTCGREQTSSRAAILLEKGGYPSTAALLGGMRAWEDAGGAIEKIAAKQE
jgi:rhodanese-related sulfurtransferase